MYTFLDYTVYKGVITILLGYIRVSTRDQNIERQKDILMNYGVLEDNIFYDKITGTSKERPGLKKLFSFMREGDTVVVSSLTRLSRSTKDLISLVEELDKKGVNLNSISESWMDTTTPHGKLLFVLFSGLAQFERDIIAERTKQGLASARARGRLGGRPKTDKENIDRALMLYDMQNVAVRDICKMTGISKATLYNYLNKRKTSKDKQ